MKIIKTKRIFKDKGIYDDRHLYKKRKGLFQIKPKADEYSIDSKLNIEYISDEFQNDRLPLDNTDLSKPVQNTILDEITLAPDISDVVVSSDTPLPFNRPVKKRASRSADAKGRFRERPSYSNPEVLKSFNNSFAEQIIDIRQGDSTEKRVEAQFSPNMAVDQAQVETLAIVPQLPPEDFADGTDDARPEASQTQAAATETPIAVTTLPTEDFADDTEDARPEASQTQPAATEAPIAVTTLPAEDFADDTDDARPEVSQTQTAATETPIAVTTLPQPEKADVGVETDYAETIQSETVDEAFQTAASQMYMHDYSEKARQERAKRLIAKKRYNRLTGNAAIAASGLLLITALIAAIAWVAEMLV